MKKYLVNFVKDGQKTAAFEANDFQAVGEFVAKNNDQNSTIELVIFDDAGNIADTRYYYPLVH